LWMVRRWRDGHREQNLWETPVPLWRKAGQKLTASVAELRQTSASRTKPLALPPAAAPMRVIEATQDPKPRPVEPSAAVVSPVPEAPRPKKQGTFWDEAKGLE
jgi:hypothetical protein